MAATKCPQDRAKSAASVAQEKLAFALILTLGFAFAIQGCHSRKSADNPSIIFTKIPPAAPGGTQTVDTIAGRVRGARPGQRVVVYARSSQWWVQPFADQPFTSIQADLKWSTSTHLGYEYAALLVEPAFRALPAIDTLPTPGGSLVTVTVVKGLPPFWQRVWFLTGSIALIFLLVWCVHLYRVYQLAEQFNIRLEERERERTRIARELHDTTLQGCHAVLLRFQAASNLLPTHPEEAKQRLDSAIDQAAQAMAEVRDAVQGLRSSTLLTNDLDGALGALGKELAAVAAGANKNPPAFSVEVEGTPRNLQPILRDEVYRIASEAVRNTFLHAGAQRIEVAIYYDQHHLRLRIRDDGKGMDSGALDGEGRTGHWGVRGMRERTKLVGGNLEVWSKLQYGTEVELSIPASIAYASSGNRRLPWFSRKETAMKS